MTHVSSSEALSAEFMENYIAEFNISVTSLIMETFICSAANQIRHQASFGRHTSRRPSAPRVILANATCPDVADPRKQKFHRSYLAKLQFAA